MSAEDSSLVSPQWCRDREIEWGKDSALYVTRVQGQFAALADGALFSLELLERATLRPDEIVPTTGSVTLGVDVARSVSGDQNCICVARGGVVERFVLWRSPDLEPTIARIVQEALATSPALIRIDAGGLGGGPADRLRALGFRIEAVNFGSASSDSSRYANRRSELYWSLREGLERGSVRLPDDDELTADLLAQRFEFTQAGKVQLLPKDLVRQRLGRSPDRADALVLACLTAKNPGWFWAGFHATDPAERERQKAEWAREFSGDSAGFQQVAELPINQNNALAPVSPAISEQNEFPKVVRIGRTGFWTQDSPTVETFHLGAPPGAATPTPAESFRNPRLRDPHKIVFEESDEP